MLSRIDGVGQLRRLCAIALLLIVDVHGQPAQLAPLDPPVTVRIGTDYSATDAGFYIADARGYLRELGIRARFVTFPSSSEMLPMLASDNVQVGGGITSTSLFNAVDRGLNIRFLADQGHNMPGKPFYTMTVRKGLVGRITSIAQLRGKRVGLASIGSVNEYLLESVLAAGNLRKTDVEMVVMDSYSNLTVASMTGAIDAAMHVEPFITVGRRQGVLEPFIDLSQILPRGQLALMIGSPRFAANLEVAGRFMVAYLRGVRDYVETFLHGRQDEEIYEIMARYTDLKEVQTWREIAAPGLNPNGHFFSGDVEKQIQWYRRNGYYRGRIDLEAVTDYRPVNFALQQLGPYPYPLQIEPRSP